MAITALGFADGSIQDTQWAAMWPFMGMTPTVSSGASCLVTGVTGVKAQVAIGTMAGYGIHVTNSAAVQIQLPTVSGVPKYATVVCKLDWNLQTAVFTYLGQLTTPDISTAVVTSPGSLVHIPLAIVRTTAGQLVPVVVEDLRYTLGDQRSGWTEWVPLTHGTNWLPDSDIGHTAAYRLSVPRGRVELRGGLKAADGAIDNGAQVGDQLPQVCWPNRPQRFTAATENELAATVGTVQLWHASARLTMGTDGRIDFANSFGPAWVALDGWVYDTT